jgi:hypothetical protein
VKDSYLEAVESKYDIFSNSESDSSSDEGTSVNEYIYMNDDSDSYYNDTDDRHFHTSESKK